MTAPQWVPSCSVEPKVYGTESRIYTGATMGWLRACHKQENNHVIWCANKWRPTCRSGHSAFSHPPTPPDSPFLRALGTPAALKAPPQTDTLAQRALEEWERTLCENKAVAILAEIQAGRPTIIHKDGGEMLIAIVLDRPLAEAKELVDDPAAFTGSWVTSKPTRSSQLHVILSR